ncbi:MAG: hypothetical protein M9890_10305 [Thermomicrobiales bacterium]|nr:hypothetical protein [Thermomicrobiales bacterium]
MTNQTMMLTGPAGNVAGNAAPVGRPGIGAQRSAAGRALRTFSEVGRWLLLGAAAPELLIEEERALAREYNSRAAQLH